MKRLIGLLLYLVFCCFSAVAQVDSSGKASSAQFADDSIDGLNSLSRKLLDKAPDQAFAYGKQALEAAERTQFKRGMAEAMINLGTYYQDQANYKTALEYYSGAKSLYVALQDTLMIARSYRHLGGLYCQRALYPEAQEYYREALKIAKDKAYTDLVGSTLKDLGGVAYFLKDYELALDYFTQSLSHFDKNKDRSSHAAVLNNIGVVHKASKNYALSLRYLMQAYDYFNQQHSVRDLSAVLMNIGEVHQHLGQGEEAERNYLKALAAAKKVNNIQRLAEAYDYLANFYSLTKSFEKAFRYKSLYAAYKDTLYRHETDVQMAGMAKKLEMERKERAFTQLIQDKELELLNKENKINRLELYRKNNLVLLAILMLLMVGGGAFILYKSYHIKRVQNQQLAHQNRENIHKNKLLEEVNKKLSESEKELQELNSTKDKFFGILAHDLRSPLVTLKGFVQILHQGHARFDQQEMNRLTSRIEHSLQGLTNLLDNLLQWSTTQSGIIEFAPRKVKLQQLVEENIQLLLSTAQVKDIELHTAIAPERIYADKQMLHLIVRNLISNAIKFTPRGGKVFVGAADHQAYTIITVQDTGVGIAEDKVQTLLEDTVLRTSRGTENEKGSGLGLWLCKEFVERHGGSIAIESEPGKGSTFIIRLPKEYILEPQLVG